MKRNFLYQITAASRTPDYGATVPDPRPLCPQLNLLSLSPPEQNSWVCHWCTLWSTTHNSDLVMEIVQKQKDCDHCDASCFTFLQSEELTAIRKQTDGAAGRAVRDNDRHI